MKKIVIASKNPVKIDAVCDGFKRMFPDTEIEVETISVDSGVGDQPLSDRITRLGAETRAANAKQALPEADFWIGLEGGCEIMGEEMVSFAWVVALSAKRIGSARTANFPLPQAVKKLVESGMELGDADDVVFGKENSKQQSGAVGLLTGDVVTRKTLYEQAVILALIPFKQPDLYS